MTVKSEVKKKYQNKTQYIFAFAILFTGTVLIAMMLMIVYYAREDCYQRMEETTSQVSDMLVQTMEQSNEEITAFASILESNPPKTKEGLDKYLNQFCKTGLYSGVTFYVEDGRNWSYGSYPEEEMNHLNFKEEKEKVPYLSDEILSGETRDEQFVYQAVPVIKDGETVAILYGHISLDTLSRLVISGKTYDGNASFFLVNGDSGQILVDDFHRLDTEGKEIPLMNLYHTIAERNTSMGESWQKMLEDIKDGKPGTICYQSNSTGIWAYAYYMPIGLNHWVMQIAVDGPSAFKSFNQINKVIYYGIFVIMFVSFVLIAVLISQGKRAHQLSIRDYMTGVGNRMALYETEKQIQHSKSIGVIFLDVTGLKRINDSKGHKAGDELITAAVEQMKKVFTQKEIFRLGGDEFLIVINNQMEKNLLDQLTQLNARFLEKGLNIAVGYSWKQGEKLSLDEMIHDAEIKMYQAKRDWYISTGTDRRTR